MYRHILTALDGSDLSNLAANAALHLATKNSSAQLTGCHVYASAMHYTRFGEMEPGLPPPYHQEEKLHQLRNTHDGLITEGMKTISDAYLDPLATEARKRGISWEGLTPEGRNYVELLRVIDQKKPDLVVLGACGHGQVPESGLGSLAERVLLHAPSTDVLLVRRPWALQRRPIVVGVDGSRESFAAVQRALELAKNEPTRVDLVAVFDPYFHTGVFRTISEALPEEKKRQFNFEAQEKLHDEIIDRGLEKLYEEKLLQGKAMAEGNEVEVRTRVIKGKVFPELHRYAELEGAGLLVVGRWGVHRTNVSLLGSHTQNLARICTVNLLVATSREGMDVPPSLLQPRESFTWTPGAEEVLGKVPEFARGMARKAVEQYGTERGITEIDSSIVHEVADRFGMKAEPSSPSPSGGNPPDADRVVLKKVKRFAPDFHRHILRSRLEGQPIQRGDRILVYEVEETYPSGVVRITEHTSLEFR